MPQHVIVVPYSQKWKAMYEKEAEMIAEVLGDNCIAVHHIGSTSVPGLAAKPIIDIMPVVTDINKVAECASAFEKIGYEYLGEFGISGRRYLRKGGDERTHQVHIFEKSNDKDIGRHLAVRDYLCTHEEAAREYGELKKVLAEKFPYDIESYCDGKDGFVKELERKALEWKRRSAGAL